MTSLFEMNRRTLFGLIILALLCAWLVQDRLWQNVSVKQASVESAARDLALLEAFPDESIWVERRAQSVSALGEWEALFWPAPTPGIAAATIDAVLNGFFGNGSTRNLDISVDPTLIQKGSVSGLLFSASFSTEDYNIPSMLAKLSSSRQLLIVETIQIERVTPQLVRVEMDGFAPARPEISNVE